ncbi:MAG: SH3 domain-containing protein [Lachnospiraceae bacterium]|nr:SH3 domain-containing protein [Lachnospiraceae bacterium]
MNRNFVIAMAAALSITSAAGAGIGGYVMGHSNNKVVMSTAAMAGPDVSVSSLTANTDNSGTAQLIASNPQLISPNPAADSSKTSKPREFTVTPANYTVYCSVSALNVRTAPEVANSSILGYVTQGQALQVTGEVNGYTWLQVNYNGKTAYVSSPYVQKTAAGQTTPSQTTPAANKADTSSQTSKPREFTVTPANYTVYCSIPALNIRTAPEVANSSVLGYVTQGQALQVTGEVNGYTWLQVNYNGKTAYVSTPYVQKAAPTSAGQTGATSTATSQNPVTPAAK